MKEYKVVYGTLQTGFVLQWKRPIVTISPTCTPSQRRKALAEFRKWYAATTRKDFRLILKSSMPDMGYGEASRIIEHSSTWLLDKGGNHNEPLRAAIDAAREFCLPEVAGLFGFAVGRAYGIREERERRRTCSTS